MSPIHHRAGGREHTEWPELSFAARTVMLRNSSRPIQFQLATCPCRLISGLDENVWSKMENRRLQSASRPTRGYSVEQLGSVQLL